MRLLCSFVGGEGHLRPLLGLGRAAAAAGHEVHVTGAEALGPTVRRAGLAFTGSGPDVTPYRGPLQPVDMAHEEQVVREAFAGRFARARAAAVFELCQRWRPDVLVCDEMDFGATVAAQRLSIPHATVVVIAAGGFTRADLIAEPLDRLRSEYGLPSDPDLATLNHYLVLAPVPPSYRDPAYPLPVTAHHYRPTPAPGAARSAVVERLGGAPTVYVTLGTIVNTESGDLFTRILTGLRDLPGEVVLTVGHAVDPADLGPQPGNVHVERYIDQAELLPYCTAVINHAGSGSVLGALDHGLPLVCIPIGADQPLNAARCTALGVAVTLDAVTLTPADVEAAAVAVLIGSAHRDAAHRLSREIHALPDTTSAVTLLEQLPRLRS